MSEPVSHPAPSPRLAPWLVLAMLAMVAVPATITLNTVQFPAKLQIADPNPTPHGYTWSLLLFIVPIVVIAFWFVPHEGVRIPRQAFWRTIGVLVPCGFALDFFFASRLFVFPNPGATLQVGAPALGKPVPVEEYVFYLAGFITILLIYVWLDEFWLAAYNVPDYAGESKMIARLLRFDPSSAVVAAVLIVVAVVYKKEFSADPEGFPLYFVLLVAVGLIPSASFFPTARRFINWRAFSLTLFFILLVSLLWEATLAVPYGWWGYQSKQMMGLGIGAWSGLPVEAVCVWIAVTYATVIVFEVVKLWQASEKPSRQAFLGWK
ncbi:MAG: hypothetical protein WAQ52_01985 [Terriglobales bacterium]